MSGAFKCKGTFLPWTASDHPESTEIDRLCRDIVKVELNNFCNLKLCSAIENQDKGNEAEGIYTPRRVNCQRIDTLRGEFKTIFSRDEKIEKIRRSEFQVTTFRIAHVLGDS